MKVRSKTLGADDPASRPLRRQPREFRGWMAPVLVLGILGTPAAAEASPPFLSRLIQAAPAADTSRIPALGQTRQAPASQQTWELIRESSQRLLEPDTRILRYTARFTVPRDLANKIVEEAHAAGIDPELAFRLVYIESRFQVRARGPQGALGLTQLMPSTARGLDRSLRSEAEILDPRTNLRLGLRYLRTLIERYDDVRLGLLAYNRGSGTVDRALQRGQDPENGYSRKVLGSRLGSRYTGPGLIPRTPPVRASAAD